MAPATSYVGGSGCNSCVVTIPLPFTYYFYGAPYNSVNASNKGTVQFSSSNSTGANACPLPSSTLDNFIAAYWDDLNTFIDDTMGIYTSVSGTAPNRVFNMTWVAGYLANDATAQFQLRLYEGQERFDLVYGDITRRGFSATVGVELDVARYTQWAACNTFEHVQQGYLLTFQRACTGASAGRR
jgi:hypothetical protein